MDEHDQQLSLLATEHFAVMAIDHWLSLALHNLRSMHASLDTGVFE
jgi:hypothetical protein